jgi:hypothetical protein
VLALIEHGTFTVYPELQIRLNGFNKIGTQLSSKGKTKRDAQALRSAAAATQPPPPISEGDSHRIGPNHAT